MKGGRHPAVIRVGLCCCVQPLLPRPLLPYHYRSPVYDVTICWYMNNAQNVYVLYDVIQGVVVKD